MAWLAHDDMVKDFDFEELPGPNQVAGYFDVGFAWRCVSLLMLSGCANRGLMAPKQSP